MPLISAVASASPRKAAGADRVFPPPLPGPEAFLSYRLVVPLLFWAIGMLMAHHPMILSGLALVQLNPGDTRLNNYILEHSYRWVLQQPGHEAFWDMPFFFPAPNTAAYTDVLLSVAPLYWVWRLFGVAADTSLQLWMLTLSSLNFLAAYLFLRRAVVVGSLGSSVGAFLFAFASVRIAQVGHQQLLGHFYTVVAVYALVRIFRAPMSSSAPPRLLIWIAVFFLSVVAQLYAGFYLGWFVVLGLGIAALWALARPGYRGLLRSVVVSHPLMIGAVATAAALLLLPMAVHYLEAARQVGMRPFLEVYGMLPRPHSWFYMGEQHWLYGRFMGPDIFRRMPIPHEQQIGLGFATLVMVVAGLFRERRRPLIGLMLVVLVACVVLATTLPKQITLWHGPFHLVPGAKAIRAVSRIALLMLIPASVGVAVFIDRMRHRHLGLALAMAALVVLEQGRSTGSYSKEWNRAEVARLAQRIPTQCQAFFFSPVEAPGGELDWPEWKYQVDALWAQMEAGIPTVNGYSGNHPPGWGNLNHNIIRDASDEARLRDALNQWAQTWALDEICWIR